ncbi:MAG: hypothetical protein KJP04_01215 [Arenicella sp.]|nr:hypothetical protein [Arenicella sp.]
MVLLVRKLKHSYFANDQFRKYLGYALGEMVLVIVGILIALQIDNWNSEKQREEILNNNLGIVANNIGYDLKDVADIRSARESAYELAARWRYYRSSDGSYTTDEVQFAGRTLAQARQLIQFNPTNSGYEALKSSGSLDRLQGTDFEALLYDYYDTADRILSAERSHNEFVTSLWLQVLARWPSGLSRWAVADPALMPEPEFVSHQPLFAELFNHSTTLALYRRAESTGPLILDYERLQLLGNALITMVNNGSTELDDTTRVALREIYDPRSGIGYANVIVDGQIAFQAYFPGTNNSVDYAPGTDNRVGDQEQNSPVHLRSFEKQDGSLHIDYAGGAEWVGFWYLVGMNLESPEFRDYSKFDKLVLELKGDQGGETVIINMEDWEDPRDGSSSRVALQLTDQWQTYEIELARFETADLKMLRALGFILLNEAPQSFSVRTMRFAEN